MAFFTKRMFKIFQLAKNRRIILVKSRPKQLKYSSKQFLLIGNSSSFVLVCGSFMNFKQKVQTTNTLARYQVVRLSNKLYESVVVNANEPVINSQLSY